MKKLIAAVAVTSTMLFASAVQAAPVPYAGTGENPTLYSFTAASSGDLIAYFAGSGVASYTNDLGLLVNGVDSGIYGLQNQVSVYGAALNFGHVDAGDSLIFILRNLAPGNVGPWYSLRSMNSDGVNHVYSSAYAGDSLIPAGTYVAFEDLPAGGDFNYTDESFVFTNVVTSVPEPGKAALLGLGLGVLGIGGLARRLRRT